MKYDLLQQSYCCLGFWAVFMKTSAMFDYFNLQGHLRLLLLISFGLCFQLTIHYVLSLLQTFYIILSILVFILFILLIWFFLLTLCLIFHRKFQFILINKTWITQPELTIVSSDTAIVFSNLSCFYLTSLFVTSSMFSFSKLTINSLKKAMSIILGMLMIW